MTTDSASSAAAPVADPADALHWAFHTRFADYISRMDDGRITVTGGALLQPDGRAIFPRSPASTEASASPEIWRGTGTLQFTGHHGMLTITLAEPAVVRADGRYLLTVDDPFEPGQRMPMADLGLAPVDHTAGTLHVAEPRLTEEGADLFFGHYHRGTPLAPLDLHVPARPATPEA